MKLLLNGRTSRLFYFLLSVQIIALGLAIPIHEDNLSTLLARESATCENFPGVVAGRYYTFPCLRERTSTDTTYHFRLGP